MSGLPNISISHVGGGLGKTNPTKDAVAGLALSGAAVAGKIALAQCVQIFSLEQAEDDYGLTEVNNELAYKEISAFYRKAGKGAELWFLLFDPATSLEDVCDKQNEIAKKLLDAAEGTIRIFGANRKLPNDYVMSNPQCIDDDVLAAGIKLQELQAEYLAAHKPFVGILPGLGFEKDNVADLLNLHTLSQPAVSYVLWSDEESGKPAIGHTLGKMARIPVQRNIGRVKDGDEGLLAAYFPDGTPILEMEASWNAIHDKGYIFLRKIFGRAGYFLTDDPTAVAIANDFMGLARVRTINKAHVLAYDVLVEELNDDVELTAAGKLPPSLAGYYQSQVENALRAQMKENISAATAFVDPNQDILSTDKLTMTIKVVPRGQIKAIEAELSFDNPLSGS